MRLPLEDLPPVSVAETQKCPAGRVDLWLYRYDGIEDADLWAEYETLLSPAEQARHERFLFPRDRRLFLATRALVRTTLSRYGQGIAPAAWQFEHGPNGRPAVAGPDLGGRLHFNLSNTPGLVVCAVSLAHAEIGVDAEACDRSLVVADIAERNFSGSEVQTLRALPAEDQARRFFAYWTLKESYLKARGLGLSLALHSVIFDLGGAGIAASMAPEVDDAARWRFALLSVAPRHLVAVSVAAGGAPLRLSASETVPLRGPPDMSSPAVAS